MEVEGYPRNKNLKKAEIRKHQPCSLPVSVGAEKVNWDNVASHIQSYTCKGAILCRFSWAGKMKTYWWYSHKAVNDPVHFHSVH